MNRSTTLLSGRQIFKNFTLFVLQNRKSTPCAVSCGNNGHHLGGGVIQNFRLCRFIFRGYYLRCVMKGESVITKRLASVIFPSQSRPSSIKAKLHVHEISISSRVSPVSRLRSEGCRAWNYDTSPLRQPQNQLSRALPLFAHSLIQTL